MLSISFFKNKRVTVFGLGLNTGGVGAVRFLAKAGAREIIVTDIKKREELLPSLEKLKNYKNVTYVLGQHRPEDFTRVDMVIKNPRVPWTNEYVKLAQKSGIPVEMDSSIFFALAKAPIIGVTGSKGKTTTAALISHILEQAEKKVVRVGLDRISVLDELSKISPDSLVVFELSSWRLSALAHLKKSPSLAVLTNLYPDHLDYYRSLEGYYADKKIILEYQEKRDRLIANKDNEAVRELVREAPGKVIWFSQAPLEGEEEGVWQEEGKIMKRQEGVTEELFPLPQLSTASSQEIENVLAATAAVLVFGIAPQTIKNAIEKFPGVPHRMEKVGEHSGIAYYNDTAATIPEAAIRALHSFRRPVILLAGGSNKGLDFSLFAEEIRKHTKKTILFQGDATEKILAKLRESLSPQSEVEDFPVVESMAEALRLAQENAQPGDVILLSPGATSFGIFQNEFDRGEQFRKGVKSLV